MVDKEFALCRVPRDGRHHFQVSRRTLEAAAVPLFLERAMQ
jgi:hypothetical protein